MAFLSGVSGYVSINGSTIAGFTNCTLTYGANIERINVESGNGAELTLEGRTSGEGSFDVVVDGTETITSLLTTGQTYTINIVHTDTGSVQWTGTVRIGQYTVNIDRSGPPQTQTIPFVVHGTLTPPS